MHRNRSFPSRRAACAWRVTGAWLLVCMAAGCGGSDGSFADAARGSNAKAATTDAAAKGTAADDASAGPMAPALIDPLASSVNPALRKLAAIKCDQATTSKPGIPGAPSRISRRQDACEASKAM